MSKKQEIFKVTNITPLTHKTKQGRPSPMTLQFGDIYILPLQFAILQSHQISQTILEWAVKEPKRVKIEPYDNPLNALAQMEEQYKQNFKPIVVDLKGVKVAGMDNTDTHLPEEDQVDEAGKNPFAVVAKRQKTGTPEFSGDIGSDIE